MSFIDLFKDDHYDGRLLDNAQGLVRDIVALICVLFLLLPFDGIREEYWTITHNGFGWGLGAFGILLFLATIARYFLSWSRTFTNIGVSILIAACGFIIHTYGFGKMVNVLAYGLAFGAIASALARNYKLCVSLFIPAVIFTLCAQTIFSGCKPTSPEHFRTMENSTIIIDGNGN